MSPERRPPPPPQETPYVFQRLERGKDHLAADAQQHVLDAPQRAWYLRTTAEYLGQHLLEAYRRRVEEAAYATGLVWAAAAGYHAGLTHGCEGVPALTSPVYTAAEPPDALPTARLLAS